MTETSFDTLVKEIGEAVKLDDDSQVKEAYKKYVVCIYKIATNLVLALNHAGGDVIVNKKTNKEVKLAAQCVDRVAVLIEKLDKSPKPKQTMKSFTDSVKSILKEQPLKAFRLTKQTTIKSGFSNNLVPSLPPENNPYIFRVEKTRTLSPMEIAQKQNQSLMAAYKARMNRLNRSDFNAFNYSLTIQRKLAENIAIARAQEEEIARKMQARNQRLEEEAAKRFATPIGMSKAEQEQRQIYKRILEYENEAKWLKNWRSKLEASPEDPILISQLVAEVLRCADHPLTVLLKKYQLKIYERLYPLVNDKHKGLDQIKIPLLKSEWPTLDEVSDIVFKRQTSLQSPSASQERKSFTDDCQQKNGDAVDGPCQASGIDSPSALLVRNEDDWDDPLCVRSESSDSLKTISKDSQDSLQANSEEDNSLTSPKEIGDEKNGSITMASSSNQSPSKFETAMAESKQNLELALQEGQDLASQLSWERRQAQLLMRQVTHDYSSYKVDNYDEDNLDYLFDEDESGENCGDLTQQFWESLMSHRDHCPPAEDESSGQDKGSTLGRSVSHQLPGPPLTFDDPEKTCHSLPASFDEPDGVDAKTFSKMHLEAYKRHLASISEDIHRYLEKLLVMMTIAYEPLDTPVGRDQCAVSLEEPFFKPIWKTLFRLFRVVNYKQELVLASIMTKYSNITPEDLKVSKKLCLTDSDTQPYQAAITELSHVQDYYTMLTKLECVVKVCRMICECVDEYYKKIQDRDASMKKAPSLGADDLLPILSYVIIRSGLPQLAAECEAMTEFIHEGYMMGEEGYCLTTLRTALNFVTSLYPTCLTS
uniref:VPS9 domain-containing protein n=1 Tax=Biomphalaria glabrata TaxID=6526 RepID=A0A2C9KGW0_BIOGL